jgi:hypothetical protein
MLADESDIERLSAELSRKLLKVSPVGSIIPSNTAKCASGTQAWGNYCAPTLSSRCGPGSTDKGEKI